MAYKGSGKKNRSFAQSVQDIGTPKRKKPNRNNKSATSIAKSTARGKSAANRNQKGLNSKTHHKSLKGGGGNGGGKKRR